MNSEETQAIIRGVQGNWPSSPMIDATIQLYSDALRPFGYQEVMDVFEREFAPKEFPPRPLQLRDAVIRARLPKTPEPDEIVNVLADAVASVGRYSPEPLWPHPVYDEVVRAHGGWRQLCNAMPARETVDHTSASAWGTFYAQTRDGAKAIIGRYERQQQDRILAELHAGHPSELDAVLVRNRQSIEEGTR